MRAVWSFWSRPFARHRAGSWGTERNHLLAWVLSTGAARRHYPRTALVTDSAGARMLVDGLGLEFDSVSTSLDALSGHDPSWWALGKLFAHREQAEPFVHLDTDVFLWKRLPSRLEGAPVFAQNPEAVHPERFPYRTELLDAAVDGTGGWLPAEWRGYAGPARTAACCGVVGGADVDFIRWYAALAVRMLEHPANRAALRGLEDADQHMVSLEQYLLSACVAHHRERAGSPFRGVRLEYLFPSWEAATDERNAAEAGFTHLMCDAKREPGIVARIERRVMAEHPEAYERCLRYLGGREVAAAA
ncbi:MAG TPA: DUF6734 family protein [Longimicrobiaceae bacterium]|jgi:hypothetical protein